MSYDLSLSPQSDLQQVPREIYIAPGVHVIWAIVLWLMCIGLSGGVLFLFGPVSFFALLLEFWVLTTLFIIGLVSTTYLAVVSRVARIEEGVIIIEPKLPAPLKRIAQTRYDCAQISHVSPKTERNRHGTHYSIQLHKVDGSRRTLFPCKDEHHMRVSHDHLSAYLEQLPSHQHDLLPTDTRTLKHIDISRRSEAHTLEVRHDNESSRQTVMIGVALTACICVLLTGFCITTDNLEPLLELITGISSLIIPSFLILPYGYRGMHRTILTLTGRHIEVSQRSVFGSSKPLYIGDISGLSLQKGDTIDLLKQNSDLLVSLSSSMTQTETNLLERYLTYGQPSMETALIQEDATIPMMKALPAHMSHTPPEGPLTTRTFTPPTSLVTPSTAQGTSLLRTLAQNAQIIRFGHRAALTAALQRAHQSSHPIELGEVSMMSVFAPIPGDAITLSYNPRTPHTLVLTQPKNDLCHHITLFDSGFMLISDTKPIGHNTLTDHADANYHWHLVDHRASHDLSSTHEAQVKHVAHIRALRPVALNDIDQIGEALSCYAYCQPRTGILFDLGLASAVILLSSALAYLVGTML